MKNKQSIGLVFGVTLAALSLGGCSTPMFSSSSVPTDDLYATHNTLAIKQAELDRREQQLAAREAELKRQEEVGQVVYQAHNESENPYEDILSDNYRESYEHRLKGMSSGTYKLSSSYSDVITSGKIHYLSAYDPAFYNVMVMGDEVWVEPKYISSMFGDWGSSSRLNVNINLNYGWGGYYPWRYWGSPYDSWYTWGWNPYWGWDYYWGWNHYYWWPGYWSSGYWGPGYWGGPVGGPSWHHHTYHSGNVSYGKPGGSNYRPIGGSNYRPSGGNSYGGSSYPSNGYRRGNTVSTPSYSRPGSSSNSGIASSTGSSYRRGASSSPSRYGSISSGSSVSNSYNGGYRRSSGSTSGTTFSTPTPSYRSSGSSFSGGGGGGSVSSGASSSAGGGGGGGYRR